MRLDGFKTGLPIAKVRVGSELAIANMFAQRLLPLTGVVPLNSNCRRTCGNRR